MVRRVKQTNQDQKLSVREHFELFVKRAGDLWDEPARKKGFNVSFNMNWCADTQQLTTTLQEPESTELRSFLMTFRKFISQDSPIHQFYIYNLCRQHIADDAYRQQLMDERAAWQRLKKQAESEFQMRLTVDNCELNIEQITKIWINGHYFHDDVEGMRFLESLPPYQFQAARVIFLDYVIESTKIIFATAHIIHAALQQGKFKD
jgi:hypothetical protein